MTGDCEKVQNSCCLCGEKVHDKSLPYLHIGSSGLQCHLHCAFAATSKDSKWKQDCNIIADSEVLLPIGLHEDLRMVCNQFPQFMKAACRRCTLRLAWDDARLKALPGSLGIISPAPPLFVFAIENLQDLHISSCALTVVPPESFKRMRTLWKLVFISTQLTELPEEIGYLVNLRNLFLNGNFLSTLPDAVGQLPALEELCVDANQIHVLPNFTCPKLYLFTAPGNLLKTAPRFASAPSRIELHGNLLSALSDDGHSPDWTKLGILKAMGNCIQALPLMTSGEMQWLQVLNLSDNLLGTLPGALAELKYLEWLLVYNNRLTALPHGIMQIPQIARILVEGNPLTHESLEELVSDAHNSNVSMVGLDDLQFNMLKTDPYSDETAVSKPLPLPACFSVGSLIHVGDKGGGGIGMYMKLTRASQLRRAAGVLVTGGPSQKSVSPADVLVIACAASQGEPEWHGLLRTIPGAGNACAAKRLYPPPRGRLSDALGIDMHGTGDKRVASLWKLDSIRLISEGESKQSSGQIAEVDDIADFDVLSICDGRMRWYAEDVPALEHALHKVCGQYRKRLFIGASMGGFGAILHGGMHADAVLAFGPQAALQNAMLRPPAANIASLKTLSEKVHEAMLNVHARGASVEVHCAPDSHLEHAISLPLGDCSLTVHPILPRTPFTKLLDRAGFLWSIIAKEVARLQGAARAESVTCIGDASDTQKSATSLSNGGSHAVSSLLSSQQEVDSCVACWGPDNLLTRHRASRYEIFDFFFGIDDVDVPRAGDWYCASCSSRNFDGCFFCYKCFEAAKEAASDGVGEGKAQLRSSAIPKVLDPGARRVLANSGYPRPGDWGCGVCGAARIYSDSYCGKCGTFWDDLRNFIVGAAELGLERFQNN